MRTTTAYTALMLALSAPASFAHAAETDPVIAGVAQPRAQASEVLKVDRYDDDGSEGTLRWALEKNNTNPGHYRIELHAVGAGPYVILTHSELPPIKGPVVIENVDYARSGKYVAIDGAQYVGGTDPQSCPGAVPGQYGANVRTTTKPGLILRDTQGVELRGVEVRNFCIGILINRASGNLIEDNRIVHNIGGAGLMMTGDDGKGNSTATTTVHNKILRNSFIDNGDGMEATRGAAFNLIADNFVTSSDKSNKEPSQGLEMLWGNDNIVVHNHWENLSDGVQLNWGNRNFIAGNTFEGTSSAVTLSGSGNIVSGNVMRGNRVAVSVRPQAEAGPNGSFGANRVLGPAINTITANVMVDNGKDIKRCFAGGSCLPGYAGAIVFNVPGLEHSAFIGNRGGGISGDTSKLEKICAIDGMSEGCEPPPNKNQQPPVLARVARHGNQLTVSGKIKGEANSLYRLEFFSNSKRGMDEAENYLGFLMVPVPEDEQGTFQYNVSLPPNLSVANVTATATTEDGATSTLSQPVAVK